MPCGVLAVVILNGVQSSFYSVKHDENLNNCSANACVFENCLQLPGLGCVKSWTVNLASELPKKKKVLSLESLL